MKILFYNCQQGKLGHEYLRALIDECGTHDLLCLQRFPEVNLNLLNNRKADYHPSYPGCAFGLLVAGDEFDCTDKGYTLTRRFTVTSQSCAFQHLNVGGGVGSLLHHLGPYPDQESTLGDYRQHLSSIFAKNADGFVLGDFHYETSEDLDSRVPPSLINYMTEANFLDSEMNPLNLSKLYGPRGRHVTVSTELVRPIPQTHIPCWIDITAP